MEKPSPLGIPEELVKRARQAQQEAIDSRYAPSSATNRETHHVRAQEHPSYNIFAILSFLIPAVGIIGGLVMLSHKDDQLDMEVGRAMILWALVPLAVILVLAVVATIINPSSSVFYQ